MVGRLDAWAVARWTVLRCKSGGACGRDCTVTWDGGVGRYRFVSLRRGCWDACPGGWMFKSLGGWVRCMGVPARVCMDRWFDGARGPSCWAGGEVDGWTCGWVVARVGISADTCGGWRIREWIGRWLGTCACPCLCRCLYMQVSTCTVKTKRLYLECSSVPKRFSCHTNHDGHVGRFALVLLSWFEVERDDPSSWVICYWLLMCCRTSLANAGGPRGRLLALICKNIKLQTSTRTWRFVNT